MDMGERKITLEVKTITVEISKLLFKRKFLIGKYEKRATRSDLDTTQTLTDWVCN